MTKPKRSIQLLGLIAFAAATLIACKKDDDMMEEPGHTSVTPGPAVDPATAPHATIDRFSSSAGHLMVRDDMNGLPSANAPIDFDSGAPFITKGLGPNGQHVQYYNFDVMPTQPAPIYVLFRTGESNPVAGQLNIIDRIPGDAGYNDFWKVHKVNVPANYVANSVTSLSEIDALGYTKEAQNVIVNCPVVPFGSTASLRLNGESPDLVMGWYKDKVCAYFNFAEQALSGDVVPTSPIHVTFNINPDQPNGGPGSGFRTEMGNMQTHNVIGTIPGDATYSPLWSVNVYDNADFGTVTDLPTALAANTLAMNVALVNCPVVNIQ